MSTTGSQKSHNSLHSIRGYEQRGGTLQHSQYNRPRASSRCSSFNSRSQTSGVNERGVSCTAPLLQQQSHTHRSRVSSYPYARSLLATEPRTRKVSSKIKSIFNSTISVSRNATWNRVTQSLPELGARAETLVAVGLSETSAPSVHSDSASDVSDHSDSPRLSALSNGSIYDALSASSFERHRSLNQTPLADLDSQSLEIHQDISPPQSPNRGEVSSPFSTRETTPEGSDQSFVSSESLSHETERDAEPIQEPTPEPTPINTQESAPSPIEDHTKSLAQEPVKHPAKDSAKNPADDYSPMRTVPSSIVRLSERLQSIVEKVVMLEQKQMKPKRSLPQSLLPAKPFIQVHEQIHTSLVTKRKAQFTEDPKDKDTKPTKRQEIALPRRSERLAAKRRKINMELSSKSGPKKGPKH
ncbi:hypothetical protein F4703DRAFT_1943454 [Phycomyces blakesleeanus]